MASLVERRKRALGWIGVGSLAVGIAVFLYLRPPTLEQVARRGLQAVETGDGALLLRNMTRVESDRLSLNEENVNRFLDGFLKQRLSGFVRTGVPVLTPQPESKQVTASQEYVHPDGRRVKIGLQAAVTNDGPRMTSVIASLTLSVLATDTPPGADGPAPGKRYAFWGRALAKALPELEATGVSGLLRQGMPSGKDEYYTFEEFARRSQRIAAGDKG